MSTLIEPKIGQELYGYCQGYFGRDGHGAKRIEIVAYDYIVVRHYDNTPDILITSEWGGKIPQEWTVEEDYD